VKKNKKNKRQKKIKKVAPVKKYKTKKQKSGAPRILQAPASRNTHQEKKRGVTTTPPQKRVIAPLHASLLTCGKTHGEKKGEKKETSLKPKKVMDRRWYLETWVHVAPSSSFTASFTTSYQL
jgi:hypothetical protein